MVDQDQQDSDDFFNEEELNEDILIESGELVEIAIHKKFRWGIFIILSLIFNIFGLVGYLIYYNCKPDYEKQLVKRK